MSNPSRSGRIFNEPRFLVKHWHLQFGTSCESEEDARCVLHALEATYDRVPGDAPRTADPGLLEACEASERDAMRIADQLDAWARISVEGGWSTHQVSPMRRLAAEIRADDKRRLAIEAVRRMGG